MMNVFSWSSRYCGVVVAYKFMIGMKFLLEVEYWLFSFLVYFPDVVVVVGIRFPWQRGTKKLKLLPNLK